MRSFCEKCGFEMINGVCSNNCSSDEDAAYAYLRSRRDTSNDEKFKSFFMSPDEKLICSLGNSYFMNYLASGYLAKGFAVVSDKRVYFKGQSFVMSGKNLVVNNKSSTVDLKDVTGTDVELWSPKTFLILAIVSFVLSVLCFALSAFGTFFVVMGILQLIVGGISIPVYLKQRITYIAINYAGGSIAFPLNWFPMSESEKFQKNLRIAKDKAVEKAESATANAMREAMASFQPVQQAASVSSADELTKYAQLYKDGLISEQEFADIKAKLLSK